MSKAAADRSQRQLLELLKLPGNDQCADCKGLNPRWASCDHGVFLCVDCAGLHRKMGTHISRIKSLTLDTWSKEQVDHMKAKGNLKVNAELNPDERRPPASLDSNERSSALERYIRAKYEHRSFSESAAPESRQSVTTTPEAASSCMQLIASKAEAGPSSASASSLEPRAYTASSPFIRERTMTVPFDPPPRAAKSETPSPERMMVKHVRFRSGSLPIYDVDDPPLREPSPAKERRPPVRGILRPRSALSSSTSSFERQQTSANGPVFSSLYHRPDYARFGSSFGYLPPQEDEEDNEDRRAPSTGFPVAQRLVPMLTGSALAYNSNRSQRSAQELQPPPHSFPNKLHTSQALASSTLNESPQDENAFIIQSSQQVQPYQPQAQQEYATRSQQQQQPFQQSLTSATQPMASIWADLDMLGSIGSNCDSHPTYSNENYTGIILVANGAQVQPPLSANHSYHQISTRTPPDNQSHANPFPFTDRSLLIPNRFALASSPSPSVAPNSTPTAPLRPQITGFVPSSDFGKQLAGENAQPAYQPAFTSPSTNSLDSPSIHQSPSPMPVHAQQTGFVPSSDFGKQMAQEHLRPHSSTGFQSLVQPQSASLRPHLTGYASLPSSSSLSYATLQPQPSHSYGSALPPTTNPFLMRSNNGGQYTPPSFSMHSLQQALPTAASTPSANPFFAKNMGMQPHNTGVSTNPFFFQQMQQQQAQQQYAPELARWR